VEERLWSKDCGVKIIEEKIIEEKIIEEKIIEERLWLEIYKN